MKSKFLELYNVIMEELSQAEYQQIDDSTNLFINDLKNNNNIKTALSGNMENELTHIIKRNTIKKLDNSFKDALKSYLVISSNIGENEFINTFLDKYEDDIRKVINYNDKMILNSNNYSIHDLSEITDYYKISPNFVESLFKFSYKINDIGVGPGEMAMAFFYSNVKLAEEKGDIVIISSKANVPCEVKASNGRIPDTMPNSSQCRAAAKNIIEKYIKLNEEKLINKELLPYFNEQGWLTIYNSNLYNNSETDEQNISKKSKNKKSKQGLKDFLIQQFELKDNKILTDENNKEINLSYIIKKMLIEIFSLYGESGKNIINNLDSIIKQNGDIDFTILKEKTVESFMDFYKSKEDFSKIMFYFTKKQKFIILNSDDYENIKNMVLFPSYGDKEGGIRSHTVLSVK